MDISKNNREVKKTRYVRRDRPNTRLQNKAIKALMDVPDPVIAADNAGIELDILLIWLKDQEFVARMNEYKNSLLIAVFVKAQVNLSKSVSALVEIILDRDEVTGNRIKAFSELRRLVNDGMIIDGVSDRLSEIEARMLSEGRDIEAEFKEIEYH